MQPEFLQAVADRVREALDALPAERRDVTPVLLSAHSMPLRVVADEPDYIDNLKQTAAAIAERAGLPPASGSSATRARATRRKSGSSRTSPT